MFVHLGHEVDILCYKLVSKLWSCFLLKLETVHCKFLSWEVVIPIIPKLVERSIV